MLQGSGGKVLELYKNWAPNKNLTQPDVVGVDSRLNTSSGSKKW